MNILIIIRWELYTLILILSFHFKLLLHYYFVFSLHTKSKFLPPARLTIGVQRLGCRRDKFNIIPKGVKRAGWRARRHPSPLQRCVRRARPTHSPLNFKALTTFNICPHWEYLHNSPLVKPHPSIFQATFIKVVVVEKRFGK